MSKTLLVGPAGAGKTTLLLDDFEATLKSLPDPLADSCFFILPSAEHTERILAIILQRGIRGFFRSRITTLPRLLKQIFGTGREAVASHVTRYLILQGLFENHPWDYFAEVDHRPGFLNHMLGFIGELKEAMLAPGDFRAYMNGLKRVQPDFAPKYEALAAIYESYEAALTAKGLMDEQDVLRHCLARKDSGARGPVRISKIWFDGFFDFSNLQFAALRRLSEMTGDMVITLTKDTSNVRPDLFEAVNRTEEILVRMGFEPKVLEASDKKWSCAPALSFLQRHLFETAGTARMDSSRDAIAVFEAVGIDGEIEMIARSIRRLRAAHDYRFSDFAILLRRIANYEDVIRSVFARYGIPVAIHERERLQFSPVLRVIVKMLRIFRDGWQRSDVIEFLKSSYVTKTGEYEKDADWIHELEYRAVRGGILENREDWLTPWSSGEGDERGRNFDEVKASRLKVLADLEDRLRSAGVFRGFRGVLRNAIEKEFGIFRMREECTTTVRREAASLKRFEALMDEIETSFTVRGSAGTEGIPFDAFADRFFHLTEIDLFSLREHDKNCVQVYDVSLARQKDYKVVYVAGLVEKGFPVQIREDPILSDWERRLLGEAAGENSLKERLLSQALEKYLFYLAVTRAEEKLILSYPRLDLEGQESLASYYLEEVKTLFKEPLPGKRQDLSHPYPEINEAADLRELETAVMGGLWSRENPGKDETDLLTGLANRLLARPDCAEKIRRSFYEIQPSLRDPVIRAGDYFRAGRTSATALETYGECPYRYFAGRILNLRDAGDDVNIKLKGTIRHKVLEDFFRYWRDHPGMDTSGAAVRELTGRLLDEALARQPLAEDKKYRADLDRAQLRESLDQFIMAEVDFLRDSPFKPAYFEFGFGLPDAKMPAFEIQDGKHVIAITGKIDRIDLDGSGKFGIVVDYKSTIQFDRENFELGTYLQLPLYLAVSERFLKIAPAGGEFYDIQSVKRKGFYHEGNLRAAGHSVKSRMVLDGAGFGAILMRCQDHIRKFSARMRNLEIPVRPRKCASYCPFAPLCRIEKWRLPLILEEIRKEELSKAPPAAPSKAKAPKAGPARKRGKKTAKVRS